MKIEIGNKNLKDLTATELVEIAQIENVHLYFEYWDKMEVSDFSNTLFSDTLAVDFNQKKLDEPSFEKTIVFFFEFKKFSFHWHFKNDSNIRESKRIKLETIKYLINKGYDLPLY